MLRCNLSLPISCNLQSTYAFVAFVKEMYTMQTCNPRFVSTNTTTTTTTSTFTNSHSNNTAPNTSNVPQGKRLNSQQEVLEIPSAYALLRMCYRSIDIKVKSRHARNFLKQRLIEQWSDKCKETDPVKQRHYMELAGSFLQSLHMNRNSGANVPFQYELSRRVAYEEKLKERAENAEKFTVRRRMPHPESKLKEELKEARYPQTIFY